MTLTQEQSASSQGPSDLDVMNVHVLAGNVFYGNLLCYLETSKSIGLGFIGKQQVQGRVCYCTFISKQALPLSTP